MLTDLQGKAAFVTGAASGIGFATARALAAAGARVVMADFNGDKLREATGEIAATGEVYAIELDVRSPESWAAAAQSTAQLVGDLHILFSNAGVASGVGLVEDRTLEDFDTVWAVNARGMFLAVKTFLPGMKAHGQPGHIVITASAMGLFCRPQTGIYSMSKYAALALGETLHLELRGSALGASVLCPGAVNTHLIQNVGAILPSRRDQTANPRDAGFLLSGMSPDRVAADVLRAIRSGEFYIITHPEYRALVEDRDQVLLRAFDSATDEPRQPDDLSGYTTYTGLALSGGR
jgi:NAD(P)-dependent dehydrogenase (short-subunit alcohol dehydrogenase family)